MIAALVCSGTLPAARAAAEEPCATATTQPKSPDPAKAYAEGRAYAQQKRYADARAIYAWLLLREPKDREALLAFARLDAWDGCYPRAEQRLQKLLADHPEDAEVRAALVDVLIWSGRLGDAMREAETGLARDPKSAELWRRHAALLNWSGQRRRAIESADRALAYQPGDPEIEQLRDRLYLTQLRVASRVDLYAKNYLPNLYTESLQLLHYLERFELAVDAQLIMRIGGQEDAPAPAVDPRDLPAGVTAPTNATVRRNSPPIIDGLYSLSATYHMDGGYAVGLSPGFGAPAQAIPRFVAKGWAVVPIGTLFTTSLTYSYWLYDRRKEEGDDPGAALRKQVHIFAPAVAYAVNDELSLEARGWLSYLVLPRKDARARTRFVPAAGVRALWRLQPALMLGAGYTYGPQLDTLRAQLGTSSDSSTDYSFVALTSHIVTVFGDWLITRGFGLQPMLAFEHRTAERSGSVALVYSAEIAGYTRW